MLVDYLVVLEDFRVAAFALVILLHDGDVLGVKAVLPAQVVEAAHARVALGGRPAMKNSRAGRALELAPVNHQTLLAFTLWKSASAVIASFRNPRLAYFVSKSQMLMHQGLVLRETLTARGDRARDITHLRGQLEGTEMQLPVTLAVRAKYVIRRELPRIELIVAKFALEFANVLP